MNERICIVVMAGGLSRRMGVDKRTLRHPESRLPLLEHVCGLAAGTALPVYCLCDNPTVQVPQATPWIDPIPYSGPFRALRAFGAAYGASFSHSLVLAVDMPGLTQDAVDSLLAAVNADPAAAIHVACAEGSRQYLCAAYRLDSIVAADDCESFRQFAERPGLSIRELVDIPLPALANINTPGEWTQWQINHTKS